MIKCNQADQLVANHFHTLLVDSGDKQLILEALASLKQALFDGC